MTESTPSYNTGVTDSGDAQPEAPGVWMGRFDAAYWQTQTEQAHAEHDAITRALEQALASLARVEAERDAARTALRPLLHGLLDWLGDDYGWELAHPDLPILSGSVLTWTDLTRALVALEERVPDGN
jgi:hypothetical protein